MILGTVNSKKERCWKNDFSILSSLEERSGVAAPAALKALRDKPIRFGDCCMPGEMFGWVKAVLNI